jgi:hypothetical protein
MNPMRPISLVVVLALVTTGCATVEGGFRYDYDGRVVRADGKTPVKGAEVYIARPDAPEAPTDLPEKRAKDASKYVDKSSKTKTDSSGRFLGALQTVKGWKYTEFNGLHTGGPTKPPEPPVLDEVIVYVQEKGAKPMGYRLIVPAASQAEAISGVRKIHLPDLLIQDKPTTRPATESTPALP